jgi:hypothetical protein
MVSYFAEARARLINENADKQVTEICSCMRHTRATLKEEPPSAARLGHGKSLTSLLMKSLVWKNGLDASVLFVVGCVVELIEAVAAVMMNKWY